MDLHHLRCFVAAAEELHFGRAARRLDMMPSALGRHVRLLEDDLATTLIARTTRSVALTDDGIALLEEARALLAPPTRWQPDFGSGGRRAPRSSPGSDRYRCGGARAALLHDVRERRPDIRVQLLEDKTIRLLPRLLSGRLDLALVRPPQRQDKRLEFLVLLHESAVVAVPATCAGTAQRVPSPLSLATAVIVPDRRSRPHSYDLTLKLFEEAGHEAHDRAGGRGEADHRQPRRSRTRPGYRPALGVANGHRRRPLHSAGGYRHEQAAAGRSIHAWHPRSRAG